MTPDELRALADEADDRGVMLRQPVYMNEGGQRLWRSAPDLARLCAELGEALEEVHARICSCELPGGDDEPDPWDRWICFAGKEFRVLAKLKELK